MASATQHEKGPAGSRELRQEYRKLQAHAKRSVADLANLQRTDLQNMIKQADKLHRDAEKPKEHALDAELFEMLTHAGLEATKRLDVGHTGPSISDFILALNARFVGGDDPQHHAREDPAAFDWPALDAAAERVLQAAPGVSCMLGPLDAKAKVRKVAQRRQTQRQVAELVRPDELAAGATQETDKQETDRNMEEMWEVLQGLAQPGTPIAELILNHRSFAQTIENLFTLAFLVKDGRVQMWQDEQLGICCRSAPKRARGQAGAAAAMPDASAQFIVTLDMAGWEDMRRVVRAADCKMKHRESQEEHEAAIKRRRGDRG